MTPQQIEDAARRKYNSYSSSFYSSAEIWDLIYQAELEIARETRMLEGLTTTTTTASTQSYSFPTGVLELKRVEYDGQALTKIDFRDDDLLTFTNSNTTSEGTPSYYFVWNDTIYLRPIPDTSSKEIKIYYYKLPAIVTSASQTLEVPNLFHMSIADYVTAELAQKDGNNQVAQLYFDKWYNKHLPAMIKWSRRRRSSDQFAVVKDADTIGSGGIVGVL